MNNYFKKNILCILTIIFLYVISCVLLLFSKDTNLLIRLITYTFGGIIIVIGICLLIINIKNNNYVYNSSNKLYEHPLFKTIIQGLVIIVFGLLIVLFPIFWLRLVFGIIMLSTLIVQLLSVNDKLSWIKEHIVLIILSLLLVFSMDVIIKYILIILAIMLISLATYLLVLLVLNVKNKDKNILFDLIYKYLNKR